MSMMRALLVLSLLGLSSCRYLSSTNPKIETSEPTPIKEDFNEQRAMRDVEYQVSLGSRIPNSEAHEQTIEWIQSELNLAGWDTELQSTDYMGRNVQNIIARRGNGRPWVILGAHYDSRIEADRDPVFENRKTPVPGANDGASGVALLLELARVIPGHLDVDFGQIWLVFFDAEDNGRLGDWEWIMGSRAFVDHLEEYPDKVVIVDMIGDADLSLFKEVNSDPILMDEIWSQADSLGYGSIFIPAYSRKILDDHIPFLEAGIPAVDIIDIDYPYWHTLEDTPDKVSPQSLRVVGETVLEWLKSAAYSE